MTANYCGLRAYYRIGISMRKVEFGLTAEQPSRVADGRRPSESSKVSTAANVRLLETACWLVGGLGWQRGCNQDHRLLATPVVIEAI
jgi:hypothetical protein